MSDKDELTALRASNESLRGIVSEALSNMEYYLEKVKYEAYGIGVDDGIAMAEHPLGLGRKTLHELINALEKQA